MSIEIKFNKLKEYFLELGSLCVAYSGGVDSTFLLAAAHEVLGEKAIAVTVRSSMYTEREFVEAKKFADSRGIKHIIIDANEYNIKEFIENGKERCYYCKYAIFSKIKAVARENEIYHVADGSNADDIQDYRPGTRAIKELKVLSPLKEAELTKQEIRELSKRMSLPTWDRPSFACLASRIPYGIPITPDKLDMVRRGEELLMDMGFKQFRVRYHGNLARIELLPEDISKLFKNDLHAIVVKKFKEYGFTYISVDLEGYRTGSMNEVLNRN